MKTPQNLMNTSGEGKGEPAPPLVAHAVAQMKKRSSRASVTAETFLGSDAKMKQSFLAIDGNTQKLEVDALMAKYDVNADGNYDAGEVHAIIHDVLEQRHINRETKKGAKALAEGLNENKVREGKAFWLWAAFWSLQRGEAQLFGVVWGEGR